jgi:hypothetical protein
MVREGRRGDTVAPFSFGSSQGGGGLSPPERCLADELIDLFTQQVERERTLPQHRIVKLAHIELRAKLLFGLLPQLVNP